MSIFADTATCEKFIQELNETIYIFQKFLSKSKINSKFTPKINFYLDNSFDEAEKIKRLLLNKNVARDLDGWKVSRLVKCL